MQDELDAAQCASLQGASLSPALSLRDRRDEVIQSALKYIRRGFAVIPVPAGQKGPVIDGWQDLRLTQADAEWAFADGSNLGILLGKVSGDLIDVDLDCSEARDLAAQLLPGTPVTTGRPSSPRSHRWYICPGIQNRRHSDPKTRGCIVEVRGTGLQTLVGPSIHPSGERYDALLGEPAVVQSEQLTQAVQQLAHEVLLRRYGTIEPVKPPPVPQSPRSTSMPMDRARVLRRASAYLAKLPAAISGSGGHNATFAAATALVHGFCLSERDAFELLNDSYNPRCEPAWSDRELEHKVRQALGVPHRQPQGWLL